MSTPATDLPDLDRQLREACSGLRTLLDYARQRREFFEQQAAESRRLSKLFEAIAAGTNAANLAALIGAGESRLKAIESELPADLSQHDSHADHPARAVRVPFPG